MRSKLMNSQLLITLFAVPVVLFLLGRLDSFSVGMWSIALPLWVQAAVLILVIAVLFIFRNKIWSFLCEEAYGVSVLSVPIYILSILCAIRYKGVVLLEDMGRNPLHILGAGLLLGLFVLLCMKAADDLLKKIMSFKINKKDVIILLVTALVLNIQGVIYCLCMKKIFVWDNAGYFLTVEKLNSIFPSYEYFKAVYNSIFTTDYNYVIAVPLSIFRKLFGGSRLVFVLSIINMYVVPLTWVVYGMCRRIFKKGLLAFLSVILSVPYVVFAANTGFADIGGVVFALAALVLFLWGNDRMSLISGVLLALCIFLRRWYSFYALSFVISSIIYGIYNKNFKKPLYILKGFGFVLMFFAQPFVMDKLLVDYGDIYSAYALGIGVDIKLFTRYFGIIIPVLCMIFAIYKAFKSKGGYEIFTLLIGILCFVLFTRVQTHGQQHLALYVPIFIVLILSMVSAIESKWLVGVFVLVCIGQTASTFIVRTQPSTISEIKTMSLFPTYSAYAPVDENAESFLDICEYMDREIGEKGYTSVFLASSTQMNYDTLRNAEKSLSKKRKSHIDRESYYLPISDVDKRDGVSDNLFKADFVLVPDSLELHLSPDDQRVIAVPYMQITAGVGLGKFYQKQDTVFTLPDGREIYVYRRTGEIEEEQIKAVKDEILKAYN